MSNVCIEIQDPIYINVERIAGAGSGGGTSGGNRYVVTFPSGTTFNYDLSVFGFDVSTVTFYKPDGDEVSVEYNVSDRLYVSSNVNLLNHKMIIN